MGSVVGPDNCVTGFHGAAAANWFLVVSVPACDVRRIAIICSM